MGPHRGVEDETDLDDTGINSAVSQGVTSSAAVGRNAVRTKAASVHLVHLRKYKRWGKEAMMSFRWRCIPYFCGRRCIVMLRRVQGQTVVHVWVFMTGTELDPWPSYTEKRVVAA